MAVAFTVKGKIFCIKTIYQRIVGNWEEKMAKQDKFPMDTDLKHKNDQSEISYCEVDLSLFPLPFVFDQLEHTILNWYS